MTTAETICARVRISLRDGNSITVTNPSWTSEQINRIVQQSPVFERQILRLLHSNQYVWDIEPADRDGFDTVAVDKFMGDLGRPPESDVEIKMEIEALLSRCCAIWYFEVVPSRFRVASHAIDNDNNGTVMAQKDTATPRTSSVPTRMSGGSGSSVPTSSANSITELDTWCWNCESGHPSQETALKLANIALILNWEEVFKREIKRVIWNWNGESLERGTPVERLQQGGPEGLQKRREQEIKTMITEWFDKEFTNNPKLPKKVTSKLQKSEHKFDIPNLPPSDSIYSWMNRLQTTLLGPARHTPKPKSAQIPNPTVNNGHWGMSQSSRPNGLHSSKPSLDKRLRSTAVEMSHSSESTKFVEEKLTIGHKFIEGRQKEVALELLAWSDKQVARWERELVGTTNETIPQSTATTARGQSEVQVQPTGAVAEQTGSDANLELKRSTIAPHSHVQD